MFDYRGYCEKYGDCSKGIDSLNHSMYHMYKVTNLCLSCDNVHYIAMAIGCREERRRGWMDSKCVVSIRLSRAIKDTRRFNRPSVPDSSTVVVNRIASCRMRGFEASMHSFNMRISDSLRRYCTAKARCFAVIESCLGDVGEAEDSGRATAPSANLRVARMLGGNERLSL